MASSKLGVEDGIKLNFAKKINKKAWKINSSFIENFAFTFITIVLNKTLSCTDKD